MNASLAASTEKPPVEFGDSEPLRPEMAQVRRRVGWWRAALLRVGSVVACLILWHTASTKRISVGFVRFGNVPAPVEVARAASQLVRAPRFVSHVGNSVRRIFVGFALAAVLGVTLGLLIGRFRWAADLLLAPLEILRPIPAVAWIPLAILLFATGEQSMVYITFIGAFFPVLLSTVHGVRAVDHRLVDASRTLGAGPFAVFAEVILPGALPAIVTGLSIGMGTSWFSLVTAEMISGQFGIGYYTWEAYTLQNYPDIVVGMIAIGLLGMLSSVLVRLVGNRLMPWLPVDNHTP